MLRCPFFKVSKQGTLFLGRKCWKYWGAVSYAVNDANMINAFVINDGAGCASVVCGPANNGEEFVFKVVRYLCDNSSVYECVDTVDAFWSLKVTTSCDNHAKT